MIDAVTEVIATVDAWARRPATLLCCKSASIDETQLVDAFVVARGPCTKVVVLTIAPSLGTRIERVALEALVTAARRAFDARVVEGGEGAEREDSGVSRRDPPTNLEDLWDDVDHYLLPLSIHPSNDDALPTLPVLLVLDDPGAIVDMHAMGWRETLASSLVASIHVLLIQRTADIPPPMIKGMSLERTSATTASPRASTSPATPHAADRGLLLRAALLAPIAEAELDALGATAFASGEPIPEIIDDVAWHALATTHELSEMESRVDALVCERIVAHAGAALAPPSARYVVRTGGAHAERAGWSMEQRAVFASRAWLARWRTESDWPVGFAADVARFRRAAQKRIRGGETRLIIEVVAAAVLEGVAQRLATSPDKVTASRLALARAEGVMALYRVAEGPVRADLRAMIAGEVATIGTDPTIARARAALESFLAEADAAGSPLPAVNPIGASSSAGDALIASATEDGPAWVSEPELAWRLRALERTPDETHLQEALRVARAAKPFTRSSIALSYPRTIARHDTLRAAILADLDDVGAVEVRAALVPHAAPELARRLAAEATVLQLRGGDGDSFVSLVRCVDVLDPTDVVKLVLTHLGPAPVDKLLSPYGDLWHAAPLLARVLAPGELVLLAERIVESASSPG